MEKNSILILGGILAAIILIIAVKYIKQSPVPDSSSTSINTTTIMKQTKTYEKAPVMVIDKNKQYTATFKTSQGEMKIELFAKETPITVNNFVFLARDNFYDGVVFHRIMKDFMIQGGDPLGTGTGGPGYKFNDEPITRDYTRGTLAMANAGPNTNGSQFFIMHADYALPKNYVIFGKLISGEDTLDKIANTTVTYSPSGELSLPTTPVVIESISIEEK